MYNLLLVDDEPRQLRSLSSIIQKLRPDYKLFTATDGQEAIDIVQIHTIHLIISDIKMPVMDGLQLLEHLVRIQAPAKFVLLSGYGEFSYAQHAIRMGIFDYLVKPIDKSGIEQLLDKVDTALMQESNNSQEIRTLTQKLDEFLPAYREKSFEKWLTGLSDYQELKAALHGDTDEEQGIIFVTKLNRKEGSISEQEHQWRDQFKLGVTQKLSAIIPVFPLILEEATGLITTLILCKVKNPLQWKMLYSQLECLLSELRLEYGVTLSIGVGLPFDSIRLVGNTAYHQALEALNRSFFEGIGRVCVFENKETQANVSVDLFERADWLAAAVNHCDENGIIEYLNDVFDRIGKTTHLKPAQVISDLTEVVLGCLREVRRLTSEERFSTLMEQIRERLSACQDYRELRYWTKKMFMSIIELVKRSSEDKNSIVIQKCKDFIKESFHEDLTLEGIAQRFHFNPSYFSSFFKNQTGVSLTDYIVQVRMEQAEKLLQTTDEKIIEVARKVGYKDAGYFIRIFRREKGISPKKYRSVRGKE
jgi:two-component system, response regulator YesN